MYLNHEILFLPWFYYVYMYRTWYVVCRRVCVDCISVLFVGEFDELISALRTGDVFGEDLMKMRRNRKRGGLSVGHGRERGGKLWIHSEPISERRKDSLVLQSSITRSETSDRSLPRELVDWLSDESLSVFQNKIWNTGTYLLLNLHLSAWKSWIFRKNAVQLNEAHEFEK